MPRRSRSELCDPEKLAQRDWMKAFVFVFMIGFVMLATCISIYMKLAACREIGMTGDQCVSMIHPDSENVTNEKWCKDGVTLNTHRFDDCEEVKEELETEMNPSFLKLLLIYFIPILFLAVPLGFVIDHLGFLRVRAMALTVVTFISSCILLALYPHPEATQMVYSAIPMGLSGGSIALRLLAFANMVKSEYLLETFEKCAYIQGFMIGGQFVASLIAGFTIKDNPLALTTSRGQSWTTFGLLIAAGAIAPFIKSAKKREGATETEESPPANAIKMGSTTGSQKIVFICLSLICAFFYYFVQIGESQEEVEYMGEEAWYVITLSGYGAVSGGSKSIILVASVFIYKKLADKLIVSKRLIKLLNPATLGLVGTGVDAVIKFILAFERSDAMLTIASVCTVFGELVIVSSMCLLISYSPESHIGKVISITAITEAGSKLLSGLAFQGVYLGSKEWLEGFCFIYQIILLIVPFLCFFKMHQMLMELQSDEQPCVQVNHRSNIYNTGVQNYGMDGPRYNEI